MRWQLQECSSLFDWQRMNQVDCRKEPSQRIAAKNSAQIQFYRHNNQLQEQPYGEILINLDYCSYIENKF